MIYRCEHKRNFTQINNETLKDANLSFGARGLLSYFLTFPANWEFDMTSVASQNHISIRALRKLVKELVDAGYIEMEKKRSSLGRFVSRYNVFENSDEPSAKNDTWRKTLNTIAKSAKKCSKKAECSATEPSAKNDTINNTKSINNIKRKIKENINYENLLDEFGLSGRVRKTMMDYINMRNSSNKPLYAKGVEYIVNRMKSLSEDAAIQVEMLENAIMGGWRSIWLPKSRKSQVLNLPDFEQNEYDFNQLEKMLIAN